MGIPSFFSHILKKYPNIVLKLDIKSADSKLKRLSLDFFPKTKLHFVNYFTGGEHVGDMQSSPPPDHQDGGTSKQLKIHNLYMDCNSIIYDKYNYLLKLATAKINMNEPLSPEYNIISADLKWMFSTDDFIEILIQQVILKIEEHIDTIQPNNRLFICFDGVAPLAKMEQQRIRRYKGAHYRYILENWIKTDATQKSNNVLEDWTSSNITPGTKFMQKLSADLKAHFVNGEKKFKVKHFILSLPDEHGEGEHKIFNDIRQHATLKENSAIYGLDADLIMLSLLNPYCNNIYVFREAPTFLTDTQLLPISKQPVGGGGLFGSKKQPKKEESREHTGDGGDDLLFLDIAKLADCIALELKQKQTTSKTTIFSSTNKNAWNELAEDFHFIQDYVFMCFFLGNDFMPKAPSLNIRNNAIDKLIQIYKSLNNLNNFHFITNTASNNINWQNVKYFIMKLALVEEENIINEFTAREKFKKYRWKYETQKDKENYLNNTPVISTSAELYISPQINAWQDRYYKALFTEKRTSANIKIFCTNYLECLEWSFKYYTGHCIDWRWRYNYNYAPLFIDILKFIPDGSVGGGLFKKSATTGREESTTHFVSIVKKENPLTSNTQMAFVLPPDNQDLLPENIKRTLTTKYKKCFVYSYDKLDYQWAFCRYFWESHIKLPDISAEILESWDNEF